MEFASKLSFRRNVTEARFSKLYLILAISKERLWGFWRTINNCGNHPQDNRSHHSSKTYFSNIL